MGPITKSGRYCNGACSFFPVLVPSVSNSGIIPRRHQLTLLKGPDLACSWTGSPSRHVGSIRQSRAFRLVAPRWCSSTVSATASETKQMAAEDDGLAGWGTAHGVRCPKVEVAWFDGLRGMKAVADIKPRDAVVAVPSEMALTTSTRDTRVPRRMRDFIKQDVWADAEWYVRLALVLLFERSRGAESPWYDWIQQLPTDAELDTPLYWGTEDLVNLQYPHMVYSVQDQRADWRDAYDAAKPAVKLDDLFWAMATVRSRAFSRPYSAASFRKHTRAGALLTAIAAVYTALGFGTPDQAINGASTAWFTFVFFDLFLPAVLKTTQSVEFKSYVLCPVIDMLNHQSDVKSDVSFEYFYDQYVVTPGTPYRAGQQVFISYGARGNDELLQYYGFVERDNPNDSCVLAECVDDLADIYGTLIASRSQLATRSSQLADHTDNGEAILSQVPVRAARREAGCFSATTLAALRVLVATDAEYDAAPSIAHFAKPVSLGNELRVLNALRACCREALKSKPTTVAEDETLLDDDDGTMTDRQVLGIEFRIEKKRVLQDTIDRLDRIIADSTAAGKMVYPTPANPSPAR